MHRLRKLLGANERGFHDYIIMLEVLSENRDLQAQIKEAERMLTQIDIERMPSFALGFERGEEKRKEEGREEGMEKGMEKGREEGKAQVVRHLLGRLGVTEVSELLGLAPENVERIAAAGGDDDPAHDRH